MMKPSLVLVGPVYPYRGGIAHFTTQLGARLRKAGNPLQVISFARQYPAWLYPGKTDRDTSQEHLHLDAEYILDPLYPWTWIKAVQAITRSHPSLVLIQWWTTFWGPALFFLAVGLRIRRIPIVFMAHNVLPHEARFFDRWIVQWVLSQARACITLSAKEEIRLRDLLPQMPVYSGRLPFLQLSQVRLTQEEARQQLDLPKDEQVLLFFGIVRPYKGLGLLLEALGKLAQQGQRPRLLVAGEFWEDEQIYQTQIESLGLSAQVRVVNRYIPNEETALYFSAADLFVAPYLEGTQSGVITVAMDYGLPVLASDRIITDGVPGSAIETFAAGDVDALTAKLSQCLQQASAQASHPSPEDGWDALLNIIDRAFQGLGRSAEKGTG